MQRAKPSTHARRAARSTSSHADEERRVCIVSANKKILHDSFKVVFYNVASQKKSKALRDKRKEILLTGFPGGPLSPGFPALPFKKKNIHMND